MNRKKKQGMCVGGGIDGWTAEGHLGKCWGRLTAGHTQDCSTVPLLTQLQLLLRSALASEAHTQILTMGRALLPCAARAGQEMGNAHLQALITHNARLRMGVRGPQSAAVRVILFPFELEVYLKPRGLSVCPRAGWSWSSLTAFIGSALYGSLTSEATKVGFCSFVVFFFNQCITMDLR